MEGRKARGERRRAEIIEATLRVIERDGVAGVTHRSVAREAGLPATSSTYYFATLDDLLVAALMSSCEAVVAETEAILGADGGTGRRADEKVAAQMAGYLGANRRRALAEYELYLFAARRPELRPAARRWLETIREMVGGYFRDETKIRVFLAALDGMVLQGLIAEHPPTEEELRPLLRDLIRYCVEPR